ncbi:condensation domain-containing protein [Streptosporangium oxazolinicum]|uniref:Phthiocerol/phthiodiolone dimycocerosyl transferase n=1 Tax=Streptosporangium oxazolinicum TaxID=909287 RepID=A0ABP8AM91_9ACTN
MRRPLSPLERWYWISDQISPLNVISHVRVRGHLSHERFGSGLDMLQQRHPLLRVAIEAGPGDEDPCFVPSPAPIPMRTVNVPSALETEGGAQPHWERQLNEVELVTPVDWRTGPLARAVVISQTGSGDTDEDVHDLILTLPHCIADGTTVLTLIRQWVELAAENTGRSGLTPGDGDRSRSEPERPAPEDMLPARYRGAAGTARTIRQFARDQGALALLRPRRFEASQKVPFEDRRTRLIRRSLDTEQLEALTSACRSRGATVQGLLAAAMVASVAGDANSSGRITIGSPIDIRPDLVPPVSGREVGTYVATVPSIVAYRPGDSLWPVAREISTDLSKRRRRGDPISSINQLRWAAPKTVATSTRFLNFMDQKGPITFCLSNVGRFDFPDRIGDLHVSHAEFIAGLSVNGLFVATVNTSHARLAWNFTYVDRMVPDDRAHRLVDGCLEAVESAVK